MTNFGRLIAETGQEFSEEIAHHPLLDLVARGEMKREHCIGYLREMYHIARHTPRILALAGARLDETYRELRDWFFEQVQEENYLDVLCIEDLENLGEDPDFVLAVPPRPGSWALVAQNYYMATYGNPLGILGVASLPEGVGAATGSVIAKILRKQCGSDISRMSFMESRADFDARHVEVVENAVDNFLIYEEDLDEVIQGRRMTIHYCGRMFHDVLSDVARPEAHTSVTTRRSPGRW